MMALQFLIPMIASALYLIVFQKAGFRGAMVICAAGPVVGSVLSFVLMGAMMSGGEPGPMMIAVAVVSVPLTLLPLIILAFKEWPPVQANDRANGK